MLFDIAGDRNMTMFEVQEAAKVIVESIDANAKVIFGAIHDDKLNKNEIKVTVIASGFPENSKKKPSLIGLDRATEDKKDGKKDKDRDKEKESDKSDKEADTKAGFKKLEDEDEWSSIPAFLRRPRAK